MISVTCKLGKGEGVMAIALQGFNIAPHTYDSDKKDNTDDTIILNNKVAKSLCEQLYQRVLSEIKRGTLGKLKSSLLVTYQFAVDKSERPYLIIKRDMKRGATATIFIRFIDYGDW